MGSIPGMPADMLQGSEEESSKRFKRMMCIMDSMTDAGRLYIYIYVCVCMCMHKFADMLIGCNTLYVHIELDGDNKAFEKDRSRIVRVAQGSGTSVHEVEEILTQYTRFAQMVKTMGGKSGLLSNMPTDPRKANPNQMANMARMQQQMANMIPPEMLQQVGGMQGLQKMARQMGGMFGGGGAGRGGGSGGGGMPDMSQLQQMMKSFGGGR